jgi:hypothetical protein
MPIFKNTLDILTNPWSYEFSYENSTTPPETNDWNMERNITVDDVVLWEQLYYEPGNIGVYVAYRPYADCYLITYNLFYNTEQKFDLFTGEDAEQACLSRLNDLGVVLDLHVKS